MTLDLIAVMPVGLAGALAVLISKDLAAPPTFGALMVSGYFVAGAIFALSTGSMSDRIGWRRTAAVGLLLIVVSLVGPGLTKNTWTILASSVVAGAGAALVQPATSALIAHSVHPRHRALAMNLKMAAAPAGFCLAGLSIPASAQYVGWQATFLAAAALPSLGFALIWPTHTTGGGRARTSNASVRSRHARRRLRAVPIGMFLGAMTMGSLLAFMVLALVDVGYSAALAGTIFAILNALTVLSRVCFGLVGHRPFFGTYRAIAAMMLLGGLGSALMLVHYPVILIVGGTLAFAMGFGCMGQALAIGVRMVPESPGAAAALLQAGGMGGSALGPLVGAALVDRFGLPAAWIFAALTSVCGAVVLRFRAPAELRDQHQSLSPSETRPKGVPHLG